MQWLAEDRETLELAIDLRLDFHASLHPLGERERLLGYLREAEALTRSAYPLYSSYPYRLGVGGGSPTNQGAVGRRYLSKGDTH